jgi:hypothetical protein
MIKLAAVFVLSALSAFARLGETPTQLTERFGPPQSTVPSYTHAQGRTIQLGDILSFRQDDWSIQCTVTEGRCSKIGYTKAGEWTDQQITTVLTSNSQGARWTDLSNPKFLKVLREWKREDGATAKWQKGIGFSLIHPAFNNAKAKAEAKAKGEANKTPRI